MTSSMYDLSVMAPNGHWYTQAPQEMHFSLSMTAEFSGPRPIAFTRQAFSHGRLWLRMAPYGHTLAHPPQSTHLLLSIFAFWLRSKVMAPRGHTSEQRCERHPRQASVTS